MCLQQPHRGDHIALEQRPVGERIHGLAAERVDVIERRRETLCPCRIALGTRCLECGAKDLSRLGL